MKIYIIAFIFFPILSFAQNFEYELDGLDSNAIFVEMQLFDSVKETINENFFWETRSFATSNQAFSLTCKAKRNTRIVSPLSTSCLVRFDYSKSNYDETSISSGRYVNSTLALINNPSDVLRIMNNIRPKTTIATEEMVNAELINQDEGVKKHFIPTFLIVCKKAANGIANICTAQVVPR